MTPISDEIREALDAVKAEHGDVLRALAQSTDVSVQLQAKVDRLERELAEARGHAAHCEMERNAAMARSGALEQEADRLRAALEKITTLGSKARRIEPLPHITVARRALDGEG